MTRQEFLEILGRTLRRELSEAEVMENLRYYEDYIAREISGGKTEEQVLAALGDPRLIAKTILQVDNGSSQDAAYGYQNEEYRGGGSYRSETYGEDGSYQDDGFYRDYGHMFDGRIRVHKFGWKSWLILLLVLAVLFLILGTVFAVLWKLLPVILIVAGVSWVYRRFFS